MATGEEGYAAGASGDVQVVTVEMDGGGVGWSSQEQGTSEEVCFFCWLVA